MQTDDSSFDRWLDRLRAGDDIAAQKFWESYFERLVTLARRKLRGTRQRIEDEEDVAISAFNSFFRGVEAGRFPQLTDRDDLWRLLVTITLNKVLKLVRDQGRQKRGGSWKELSDEDQFAVLEQVVGREPTPEFAAQIAEECQRLLGMLPSEELVQLAVAKMEGVTNEEIAARWGKAVRTVERKLKLIRQVWEKDVEE
jgi:DNA-directed RNA polymerase specialized sigma24 family protein